jgi:bacterioferritin-associated ferredoxin
VSIRDCAIRQLKAARSERDELLAALKRVGSCCGCMDEEAQSLIARIEGAK